MNKYEIVKRIEDFAPLITQEPWDASGWIVDLPDADVNKILFALTVTDDVLEQAIKQGCNMIISHHPMFFVPFRYSRINIYCAHTNLDKIKGGTTDELIRILGYGDQVITSESDTSQNFVRYIDLKINIIDFF